MVGDIRFALIGLLPLTHSPIRIVKAKQVDWIEPLTTRFSSGIFHKKFPYKFVSYTAVHHKLGSRRVTKKQSKGNTTKAETLHSFL